MNILHINQSDIAGGAAISGYRLHQGLLAQGINSKLLVGKVKTSSDRVAVVPRKHQIEKRLHHFTWRLGLHYIDLIGSFDIPNHTYYKEADVLNVHNLHTEYFNYLAIPRLTQDKPTIFTLHDMWSFTGHCTYSYDCERWKIGCGKCPYPKTYPPIAVDNTHLEWKLKNWVYSRSNLTIVTASHWLTEQVKQSMLSRFSIHQIPHGIDTQAYQPLDKEQCRSVLGIPKAKKVLMFAAAHLDEYRKGSDLLLKALQNLPVSLKSDLVLLILGGKGEAFADAINSQSINLGYVTSDRLKSIAYSAADLFLFPTRADIFGLVAQEAAACGTPIVSFKVGGVPDIVRSGVTGYLAEPENIEDFSHGIVQLLEDNNLRKSMGINCRALSIQEYSLEQQIEAYIKLYSRVRSTSSL